jgi:phosphate transport system substrate-binding protein
MKTNRFPALAIFTAFFFFACGGGGKPGKGPVDTPTSGKATVGSDDSYRMIMKTQENIFEEFYLEADVSFRYGSETEMLRLLLADSIRFAVLSRKLSPEEEQVVKTTKRLDPTYIKIAYDAVALIVHPDNPVSELSQKELKQLFSGEKTFWASKGKSDSIKIVFDSNGSSNARYIRDSLVGPGLPFPANCFATKGHEDVISFVSKNPSAMGVIGVNWISDKDDSLSHSFMKQIKVLAVESKIIPESFNKPFQAHIAKGNYPLTRPVYIVKCEIGTGLGTGFAGFIAGEKGQKIILKSGLVPATMPIRIVNINKE